MTLENPYQPPAVSPLAAHSGFSRDEWFYMAKVFSLWLLVSSFLVAFIVTGQMHFALSQFNSEGFLGRITALTLPGQYGAAIVMFAASSAFVMVTHRRTKREILEPVQTFPWFLVLLLSVVTPIAITLALAMSLFTSGLLFGLPWNQTLLSMKQGLHPIDCARSMLVVFLCSTVLTFAAGPLMRRLIRIRGWLMLKIIAVSQFLGLVVFIFQSVVYAV